MRNTQWKPLAVYLLAILTFSFVLGTTAVCAAPMEPQQSASQDQKTDEAEAKKENMKRLAKQMESLTAYSRLAETSGITPQKTIPNIPQVPSEPLQVSNSR